jgi:hypothetical protein
MSKTRQKSIKPLYRLNPPFAVHAINNEVKLLHMTSAASDPAKPNSTPAHDPEDVDKQIPMAAAAEFQTLSLAPARQPTSPFQ